MMNRKKRKIGAITIGQSPRADITGDICPFLAPNLELIEYGALDGYSVEEVRSQFPSKPGQTVLVTRMKDGEQVVISEEKILPLLQACIHKAEAEGCEANVLLCTGKFPSLSHKKMLLVPQPLVYEVVKKLADGETVGLLVPDASQVPQARKWFAESGIKIKAFPFSPYQTGESLSFVTEALKKENLTLLYPDCMGYSTEIKQELQKALSLPVLLPRTFLARLLNELYGE